MLAAPTSRVCPATTREVESSLPTRPTTLSASSLTQLCKPIICPAISEFNHGNEREGGRECERERNRRIELNYDFSAKLKLLNLSSITYGHVKKVEGGMKRKVHSTLD